MWECLPDLTIWVHNCENGRTAYICRGSVPSPSSPVDSEQWIPMLYIAWSWLHQTELASLSWIHTSFSAMMFCLGTVCFLPTACPCLVQKWWSVFAFSTAIMFSAKQLIDFGYKTFSGSMIIFTGVSACFFTYISFLNIRATSAMKKIQQKDSSDGTSSLPQD